MMADYATPPPLPFIRQLRRHAAARLPLLFAASAAAAATHSAAAPRYCALFMPLYAARRQGASALSMLCRHMPLFSYARHYCLMFHIAAAAAAFMLLRHAAAALMPLFSLCFVAGFMLRFILLRY